jgi:hypothetical protein
MNHKLNLVQLRELSGPQLQHRLLAELDGLFREIEDGTVKDNTFTGCIALGHRRLPPLNENQSKQIKEVLLCAPVAADQSAKSGIPILRSVFSLIRSLWRSHDTNAHPAQGGAKSISLLLDQYGRVKGKDASPTDVDQNSQVESQEIQETDVKQFLAAQGEGYTWALPYAWEIANRLNAVKKSDTDGDLALFFERRRKLNVRRPKTTLFEQSAQRYAAKISEVYCDEKGDIANEKLLEAFIRELVTTLLEKTKAYWPTSPLLAIFDGLVATVMRPLLHRHRTAYVQSEMTTATGVIVSGSTMGKIKELVTTPKWNEKSQRLVVRYVKKAFKAQVWSLFLDRYAPYNREYSRSPHLNTATLTNVGLLIKNFGNPVHLSKVMELLQSTNQADELAQYVVDHFRCGDFIDH